MLSIDLDQQLSKQTDLVLDLVKEAGARGESVVLVYGKFADEKIVPDLAVIRDRRGVERNQPL